MAGFWHPGKKFLPYSDVRFSCLPPRGRLHACLVPFPLPYPLEVSDAVQVFRLSTSDKKPASVGLLVGGVKQVKAVVNAMIEYGGIRDGTLSDSWALSMRSRKVLVKVKGWSVEVECDLSNPLHYLVAPPQRHRWEGPYPFGTRIEIPWTGKIFSTRKLWPTLKAQIVAAGLEYEGDDPDSELSVPAEFDASRVAGWFRPAPNGHLMHAYQKEGAQFCASRGMRALVGDEMGVGKTVQAIAAAEACASPRILIICPANARYVWDRELRGWGASGGIQHITSQLDELDKTARWHIITYDLLAVRAETWRLNDNHEYQKFIRTYPDLAKRIEKPANGTFPWKIALDSALDVTPVSDPKRVAAWERAMQRLRGDLLEQIMRMGPLLAILDEAHRAKSRASKRTKAIQRIAAGDTKLLMLTGTPVRNNEHKAAVLLGLLDASAAAVLNKHNGYTIQDVKDYLEYFMIRRTKADVLPQLPAKTRQRIDIGTLDAEQMASYRVAMDFAKKSYALALASGKSDKEARKSMQGAIERARTALGVAKVLGGEVCDLVLDVVENNQCCVVFCSHHKAIDELKAQLERNKLRVAVVDGRTSQKDRAAIVEKFQQQLDVFIGGINAAGEAITLTRADTVIFVELDWVPAALLQAEDRIHRVGQKSNCQVIQLVARMEETDNLDEMMVELLGSKIARIGAVLGEATNNIIAGSIQSEFHEPLIKGVTKKEVLVSAKANGEALSPLLLATDTAAVVSPALEKRKRGRPRVYTDQMPPTATERSKQSIKALADSGGKRIMLRLTPEAHEALKFIMSSIGTAQETNAINQALIERKNELMRHTQ